jgi:hypothetical protein
MRAARTIGLRIDFRIDLCHDGVVAFFVLLTDVKMTERSEREERREKLTLRHVGFE